jgi:hypothetical protein
MKALKRMIMAGAAIVLVTGVSCLQDHDARSNRSYKDRFLAYENGTVLDNFTGLMWASRDNGDAATWKEAKDYCEKYNGGGYMDWRMPTAEELATLYNKDAPGYRPECAIYDWKVYLTEKVHLSGGSSWASADYGAEAECFMFDYGCRTRMFKSVNFIMRALPVRKGDFT